MNPFTCIFQGFCLDFQSFAVIFKTFPEHLSMTTSVCVETVLSKLLRLLFKDVFLGNHNSKQHKNKKFFVAHCTTFLQDYSLHMSF